MEVSIRQANREQVRYVEKLMLQVFLDGKVLSLAAYNWPARYIIAEASSTYDIENRSCRVVADNINLQYVNPHGHLELMTTIVKSDRSNFVKKINEARAISLRSDDSVDFTNIDKIYVMAKIINMDGSSELLFIGIGEQKQRKALGLKNAVIEAIKATFDDPKKLLSKQPLKNKTEKFSERGNRKQVLVCALQYATSL